mgnify:CR=1 FL=1
MDLGKKVLARRALADPALLEKIKNEINGRTAFTLTEVIRYGLLRSHLTGEVVRSINTARAILRRMNITREKTAIGYYIKIENIVAWNEAVKIIHGE